MRGGIEYIEVRSLDINPFTPIGVDEQQIRFLDLFMVWCVLADAPEMSSDELLCTRKNWNRVILEGRKTGLTLGMGCETAQFPLPQVGKDLFRDLKRVAQTLDGLYGGNNYEQVCDELVACFDNPELTFSARILRSMLDKGIGGTGKALSEEYRSMLREEPLEILREEDFRKECEVSGRARKRLKRRTLRHSRRWSQDTPDRKEKGHSNVAKIFISENRDDDNKCASFIYSDSHQNEKFILF